MSEQGEIRRSAMDALARREYARGELQRKLENKGFEPTGVDTTLEELATENLLSDERFVESYLNSHIEKGHGPLKLRQELRKRGVDDSLIDQGLAECEQDWSEMARDVRCKRFGEETPHDIKEKAKQMRFLTYRGFTSEQIRHALSADELETY